MKGMERDNRRLISPVFALAGLLLVLVNATNLQAEEQASGSLIEEIVVTALKRETNLMETPLAISAFTGEDLERVGADGLEEFLQFAPGVAMDRSTSGQHAIYIRGLASTYGNSPIGFYIDEVPFTALTVTFIPDVRSWDLERVEVLRGPQGTLYGASSLGGTIRILTQDPVHNEFQAKFDGTYSDTDDGGENYAVKAAVNIPLVEDTLSLRLSGTNEDYDGWIELFNAFTFASEEDHNDFEVDTARAKLLWTINEKADVVLGYWYTDAFTDNGNLADDDGMSITAFNATTAQDISSDLFSAEVNIDFDWATLTSSTSMFEYDSVSLFVDFVGGFGSSEIEIFSQELRLTSRQQDPLFWTLGAIYIENETFYDFYFNLPGFFVNQSTQDNDSTSYAIYGEATYALNDQLDATLGLRYYNDDVTRNDTQFLVPQAEIETNFTDWSPRVNFAWTPSEDRLLFATLSKGFRSGLTQPSIALGAAAFTGIGIENGIDPEDAWNYEIGGKFSFLDGRFTLDAVAYFIDWQDLQAQILLNAVVFAFVNAGDAEGQGLELAATWQASENLSFALAGNINDTTYADTVTDAFGRVIFEEGEQIQFVPEYTVSASVDYSYSLGNDWRAVARASVEQVGERTTTDNSLTSVSGESNTRINLRLGIEKGSLGAHLFAENLGNDDSRINPAGTLLARGYASRYRPRTVGINLRWEL